MTVVIICIFSSTTECSDKVDGFALTVVFRVKIVKMRVRRLIYIYEMHGRRSDASILYNSHLEIDTCHAQ